MKLTRSYLRALLILCVLGLAAGCTPSLAAGPVASSQAATLTVYARVTDVTRDVEMGLVKDFETRHGVKVNLISADDTDLLARFTVEQKSGQPTADVFAGWNPVGTLGLEQAGWLEPYVPPALADRIPQRFVKPVVIQHVGLSTLVYNPNKLSNTPPPASFADLTKPIYKNRIEMVDPIVSTTDLKLVGYLAYGALGWSYWSALHANGVRLAGQSDQVIKDIEDPKSPAAVGIAGYGRAYPDERNGKPIKVAIPAEGLVASEYVVAVAVKARQPQLARAFVDEVTFNPKLLDEWSRHYLPVTVTGTVAPAGTPPLDKVVITDWQMLQAKELEIKMQWQSIWSR